MDSTANSTQKNFTYLSNLIKNGESEIVLDCDIQIEDGEIADFAEGIPIDIPDSLIIHGNGHIIDARKKSRIFSIKHGNVVVKNLTFTNGQSPDGGAIRISKNASFKIDDSTFENNSSDREFAGDILNEGILILNTPQFSTESKSVFSTGILYISENNVTLILKVYSRGEIIFLRPLGKRDMCFSAFLCKFYEDNREWSDRLNPFYKSQPHQVFLKHDVKLDILNDEHLKFPNGIVIDRDDIIIDGYGYTIDSRAFSRIFTVQADNVGICNITLQNGQARYGGAIKNVGHDVHLSSLSVRNCVAFGSGGAVYNGDGGNITIERVVFKDNIAHSRLSGGGGGAIYNDEDAKIDINHANFTNNSTGGYGEVIYNRGDLYINNSIFVKHITKEDAPSIYNYKFAHLYIENSDLSDEEDKIIENRGLLRLFNNIFSSGSIANLPFSHLNFYRYDNFMDRKNRFKAPDILSTNLKITNNGIMKAYGFGKDELLGVIDNSGKIDYIPENPLKKGKSSDEDKWVEINLFVTSTLDDMYSERNYLLSNVFQELKEWCEPKRIIINNIDLRGGLDDNASAFTMDDYLNRRNSFFLCFVGQRHEWISNPSASNDDTLVPMARILESDSRADFAKRSLFFFRTNPFEGKNLSQAQKSRYLNENPDALVELRKSLEEDGFETFDYSCDWNKDAMLAGLTPTEENKGALDNFKVGIESLRGKILSMLKNQIEREFPGQIESKSVDDYLDDANRHNLMVESRAKNLIGRKHDLRALDLYLISHENNLILVHGGEGIGKSTLLCKWSLLLKDGGRFNPIIRLCESTPKTRTLKDLYLSIGSEAGIFNGQEENLLNYNCAFSRDFFERLKERGFNVLIISNVDKLGEFFIGGQDKDKIPEDFYLILSAENKDKVRENYELYELKGFESKEERMHLIRKYLESYLSDLTPHQEKLLISHLDSKEPLYMRILLNGIMLLGSLDHLEETISEFKDTTESAFERLISIFENELEYGAKFVRSVLALLAYARGGLTKENLLNHSAGFDVYKKEKLDAFLKGFDEYVFMKGDRYLLRYEQLREIIIEMYHDMEVETRKKLVEIYKDTLNNSPNDLKYHEINGSSEILYQMEMLRDYDAILDVFEDDNLLSKVSPNKYGLHFKNGIEYPDDTEKLGFLIADDAESISLFRDISNILLDKAIAIFKDANEGYPKENRRKLAMMYEEQDPDEFAKYCDSFYEPPEYYNASVYYATLSFKNDSPEVNKFIEEHNAKSVELIAHFEKIKKSGGYDLGLDDDVNKKAASALESKAKLDGYIKSNSY